MAVGDSDPGFVENRVSVLIVAPYASRMARSANDLVTKIRQLNQTYKRLLKGDVKYRLVIDKWTR